MNRDATREEFIERLQRDGPGPTLEWLAALLAGLEPVARSQNCRFLAYTGLPEGIGHLETLVESPVTDSWGEAAALLGVPWGRIREWLGRGNPHRLMALDALLAYRAPVPSMSPVHQIAAPSLPDRPSREEFERTLADAQQGPRSARVERAVASIRRLSDEILSREHRSVEVAALPRLYLEPESFPGAADILKRHAAVTSFMRDSRSLIK